MRQRLEKIGGRCTVQSRPGAGAEISFLVNILAEARKTR
jgi:signal transduction histidine kinase